MTYFFLMCDISCILLNHPNNKKHTKLHFYLLFFMGAYGCEAWSPKNPPKGNKQKWTTWKHTALTVQFGQNKNK